MQRCGAIRTRTDPYGSIVASFGYDAANRPASAVSPGAETTNLTRDAAGFTQQVNNVNAGITTTIASNILYNGSGQVTSDVIGNGVSLAMSYSLSGQGTAEPASPVPVVDNSDNDVPTLPEWGEIFLGSTLLLLTMRAQSRSGRRRRGQP